MPTGRLEHANISVTDPERSAALLVDLLGWHERWSGPSMGNGRTIHVGSADSYVALYTGSHVAGDYVKGNPLNHLAFVVDDLAAAEEVVKRHGLEPFGHDDYEPGRRFYFFDWDGIEFEVVDYE
ncbi:VOC family protein [Alteriqipengyuania lutimaris]|uniref:VOC family protein n=1 Tax=Alteriqipengyuania lutimaris TaxID=1538146 RepID=A0A395LQD2_9SPHN|nr:VOC family protein [Alteriqipengyuania lutimaris]MBB3033162.1 catechol 2,3-dioxygenase-like lactoylglutathione lyase family enzyme [Alteriqipengyuania lutimaris]RDS77784.1 VOC family protein [Alteriqipengyuania lutimaris]